MIKKILKKFIPKNLLLFYHKILAYLAAFFYGWPSKKLIVIGVTGTAGKSTTVYFISKILEEAGYKVGSTSSINFKINQKEIENKFKMTMPGRFFMQKILKQMAAQGCQYAVIETSSEGILQSRHLGIDYDILVFTNLSPEHIETHGSFENYKKTKGKLFAKLEHQKNKIINGQKIEKTIIANLDDEYTDYFLSFQADEYLGYKLKAQNLNVKTTAQNLKILEAEKKDSSMFKVYGLEFKVNLPGEFNIYNALGAISVIKTLEIPLEIAKKSLEQIKSIPGRMEKVINQPFKVIVDYAHTPAELEGVYQLLKSKIKNKNEKMICVLGSCGGGRDKWKRPVIGKLAAQYCDDIILTNEDPYDENPATIINEIEAGFSQIQNDKFSRRFGRDPEFSLGQISNYEKILDRRKAIKKALTLAKPNDIVVITGKGCEPWMCVANGQKISWDDRKIVQEEFNNLSTPPSLI